MKLMQSGAQLNASPLFSGVYLTKDVSILDLGKSSFEYTVEVTDQHKDKVFLNGKSVGLSSKLEKETNKLFRRRLIEKAKGVFGKDKTEFKLPASFKKALRQVLTGPNNLLTPDDVQGFTRTLDISTSVKEVDNATDSVVVLKLQ